MLTMALSVVLLALCNGALSQNKRPNIIFMLTDQQRQDSIGAYPGSGAITPNIDSIAADGILFTNSWTSTPSCTPARSAILTGRSPWGHGMIGYGAVAQVFPFELVPPLNKAGYLTACIGKNHFGFLNTSYWNPALHGYSYFTIYDGLGNGYDLDYEYMDYYDSNDDDSGSKLMTNCAYDDYDEWFQTVLPGKDPLATGKPLMDWNSWRGAPYIYNESVHPTAWVTTKSIQYLQNYSNSGVDQPFFLKISYHRPHSPYDPTQKYIDFVKNNYDLDVITNILHGNIWDSRFCDEKFCGETKKDAWCGWMRMNDTNISRIAYHANVKFIDDGVGEILNTLKELELYNNTYILFTSDHGDQLGDHNLWRKTYPYNSNAKIPMIVKWPANDADTTFNVRDIKIKRGTINNENIVELRDLLPTFFNVSQIQIPDNLAKNWTVDGLDMNCILYQNCNWREWLDLEHSQCYNETNHWNAITDGVTYKYIFNAFFANESLFDLKRDPNEMDDLAPIALTNSTVNTTLTLWRQRLIDLFEQQQRGPVWVKNGALQQRTKGQTYSPNYPGNPAPCQ